MNEDKVPVGQLPINTRAIIEIEVCEHFDGRTYVRLLPPYEGAAFLIADINSKMLVTPIE